MVRPKTTCQREHGEDRASLGRLGVLSLAVIVLADCSGASSQDASRHPAGASGPSETAIELPNPDHWSSEKQAVHVLNRLAYGPRPGDVERLATEGVGTYIARQLRPKAIPDEDVARRLAAFPTLSRTIPELQKEYPRPAEVARELGLSKDDPELRRKVREALEPGKRPARIGEELVGQKLLRAVLSERQLEEVLTDLWFNHFNVFLNKGEARWMVTSYERDAIRPNVFGRFRDLLGATASHPAMLWYLDNWASTREGVTRGELIAEERGRGRRLASPRRGAPKRAGNERPAELMDNDRKLGLNENYARELLELHTLGVDGGYSQADVREVARCFTGWSLARPREAATFRYRDIAHDKGAKNVLGQVIPAGGGKDDGERVLDLLAKNPSTARTVARKLAVKFVSDNPPEALVRRLAAVYQETGGNLREIYRALFSSPEFFSDAVFAAKTKTPLELAASALRATGAKAFAGRELAQAISRMGEPLYLCQPPTGYKEDAETWVSSGSLLSRLNFALALSANRLSGVVVDDLTLRKTAGLKDTSPTETDVDMALHLLARALLHRDLGEVTRKTILSQLGKPADADTDNLAAVPQARTPKPDLASRMAGLLLGSPEFQKQ